MPTLSIVIEFVKGDNAYPVHRHRALLCTTELAEDNVYHVDLLACATYRSTGRGHLYRVNLFRLWSCGIIILHTNGNTYLFGLLRPWSTNVEDWSTGRLEPFRFTQNLIHECCRFINWQAEALSICSEPDPRMLQVHQLAGWSLFD